jgi:hypothetical protein
MNRLLAITVQGLGIWRSWQIFSARKSLTSVCRGTIDVVLAVGFT